MIIKTFKLKPMEERFVNKFRLTRNQYALVVPFGDLHFGSPEFSRSHFEKNMHWALERDAFFIGMGDMSELLAESQRRIFNTMREGTQSVLDSMYMERVVYPLEQMLAPTRGRWLGMIRGNHTWKFADGTNVEQHLCAAMGCDYFGTMGFIRLMPAGVHAPGAYADILVHHGLGAPRSSGGGLHVLDQLVRGMDADLYLMGHSHGKVSSAFDRLYVSDFGTLYHRTKILARTGSWFKTYNGQAPRSLDQPASLSDGNYGELRAYVPSALGSLAFGIGFEEFEEGTWRPLLHYSV